jgi:uncharacterized protein YndB with AHSA1/START domain
VTSSPDEFPRMNVGMLLRCRPETAFEAFVDPVVTTKFWFTRSTGRMEQDRELLWDWEMFGATANVSVRAVEPPDRIEFEWGAPGSRTIVELRFSSRGAEATFVEVTIVGFAGTDQEVARQIADASAGFAFVLAGAKAWLEHGLALNLVADRYPSRRA